MFFLALVEKGGVLKDDFFFEGFFEMVESAEMFFFFLKM